MNIFDILGPVMVGPSSSHTAGAVRIGLTAIKLLGEKPTEAQITLSGSFAATGRGHGTDRAIVAGLLGMKPDDMRIPHSFEEAEKSGLRFKIKNGYIPNSHPNTALICLTGEKGATVEAQLCSLGGGRIMINTLDGVEINCTGECPTIIVHNVDVPGHVARVAGMLAQNGINIATMNLCRDKRGGNAVMVIETDQNIEKEKLNYLESVDGVTKVTYIGEN